MVTIKYIKNTDGLFDIINTETLKSIRVKVIGDISRGYQIITLFDDEDNNETNDPINFSIADTWSIKFNRTRPSSNYSPIGKQG